MADNRIYTFLKLCELMNYRQTAAALNMTQPSVTQHIHYLEEEYDCKLFNYHNRVLTKTPQCIKLETYARSMLYNEKMFLEDLHRPAAISLSIGATKTIGDYTMEDLVIKLLNRKDISLELIIDNTENLLSRLNALKLDLLLIEGFVDKNIYSHKLIKKEELIGICSPHHRFSGLEVSLEELFREHLIQREDGSGTRAIFENFLFSKGYSSNNFSKVSRISSFKLIEQAVLHNCGISFVYESIPKKNPELSTFRIKNEKIFHEFNFVYLKNTTIDEYLKIIQNYF